MDATLQYFERRKAITLQTQPTEREETRRSHPDFLPSDKPEHSVLSEDDHDAAIELAHLLLHAPASQLQSDHPRCAYSSA